jgi:organic radical activating enzyme
MKDEVNMVTHVSLYSWGEPLLHAELNLLIDHLHEQGIAAAVSSHLSIPSSNQIQKLVKSAPEYLKISISGFYPEAYNSTHTGGDINLVKSNMYKIKYYMERYKSQIFVDVNYHVYKNNIGKDLEMMKKLCDELGFSLSTTYPVVMPVERCIDHIEGRSSQAVKDLSKLLLVNIDEGLEITKSHRDQPCRYLTNQLNINWDRSVPVCCVSFDRQKNSSIISNDYLKEPLKDLTKKKEKHPLCTKCISHGIPPYQLGVNLKGWEDKAKQNYKSTKNDNK